VGLNNMEKLSLDEIMREQYKNKYILLHSEGPILTLERKDKEFIFHFNQENTSITEDIDFVHEFLFRGEKLISPSGKSYDINPYGDWKGMIQESEIDRFIWQW
jgi:hypothetical protein